MTASQAMLLGGVPYPTDLGTLIQWNNGTANCTVSNGPGIYAGLGNNKALSTTATTYGAQAFSAKLQAAKKYYWEIKFLTVGGATDGVVCGISTAILASGSFAGSSVSNTTDFGVAQISAGSGAVYYNGVGPNSINCGPVNSIVSVAWDMAAGTAWFAINGVWISGNPLTAASPTLSGMDTSTQRGLAYSAYNINDACIIATRASAMTYMRALMGGGGTWNTPGS